MKPHFCRLCCFDLVLGRNAITQTSNHVKRPCCKKKKKKQQQLKCFFSYVLASKPEISSLKSEEEPISGSNLTLQCRARGYPVPVVTWYKDQIKLNKTEHVSVFSDGKLSIEKLASGDSGVYTCKALNNMGMDKKHVEIKVQEPVTSDSSVTSTEKMSC